MMKLTVTVDQPRTLSDSIVMATLLRRAALIVEQEPCLGTMEFDLVGAQGRPQAHVVWEG